MGGNIAEMLRTTLHSVCTHNIIFCNFHLILAFMVLLHNMSSQIHSCLPYLNSSKKVRKLEFHRSYFSYHHISNIVFDIIRKPVYLSLNWYHICNGYEIMESILQLVLIESQKWNLAKHCVLAIVQTYWRMKTIGVSLLGNTNELQDFISDLHSYPAALYIP